MSRSVKPQICESNTSYCKFGAETHLKLLEAFESQICGAIKSEDVECVHKMRVASRRIRAAMALFRFCFPRKKFKKWLGEIKNTTQLLGEARDLDVQIAFIQQYMKKLESPKEKSSLDLFLENHKNRRTSIQPSVVRGLEQLQASDVLLDICNFCKETVEGLSKSTYDVSSVMEKAHWQILYRLNDFLAMKKYVQLENEILKHHEMRILAKRFRYTLEAFAPLYKSKLDNELKTMKAFQDVLGEMHDRDVWIDYIPKFLGEANSEIKSKSKKKGGAAKGEQALLDFLGYIKGERKKLYDQFVQLWDENEKKCFFEQLRKTTKAGSKTEEKIKRALSDQTVKIAVLADIHANLRALEAVIQDAEEKGVSVFLNAGDSIGFGPCPNEVLELLNEKNVLSVLGNYDLEVIEDVAKEKGEKKLALEFARKELAKLYKGYLFSLPRDLKLKVASHKLLVVHGSPESIEEHIYHDTSSARLKTLAEIANADVVIVGHSHEQFWNKTNGVSFVNPGSVGRPGDGNPRSAYAILSFSPFKVDLVRLEYDVAATVDALRKKALPESFAQMLLRGVALDVIVEEDRARKDASVQDCGEIVKISQNISETYWQDTKHYTQVTKLALAFFDGLGSLHQLGKRERCWLECAAILHDIGLSHGASGHHKQSQKLILNDTRLPFTSEERRIIACIARYHRKVLPKQNHHNLATLDRVVIHKIKILAGLLRVADSLDYTHQSIVKNLTFKITPKKITAEYLSNAESTLEEQAFNKKKDLFEKVFNTKLVLVWKQ